MSQVFEVFRYDNPDGTAKDWAISRNPTGGYTKCWGKTGSRMQVKGFAGTNATLVESEKNAKLNKGYRPVGTAVLNQDGKLDFSGASRTVQPTVEEAPKPARIYYRIAVKDEAEPAKERFRALILQIFDQLIGSFPDNASLSKLKSDYTRRPISSESGQMLPQDGVDSLIFFMTLMAKSDGGIKVSLAHEDGVEISSKPKLESKAFAYFGSDMESNRTALESVGLLQPRLDLSSIQSDVADYFF